MTQHQLIKAWIRQYGSFMPSHMNGKIYLGQMFGSESGKRCREMRAKGELISWKEGKFEVFGLSPTVKLPDPYKVKEDTGQSSMF